jgi:4-hydroxy-tetrahydrodipicolinate reductase
MPDIKIAVMGCGGRMGRMLLRQIHQTPGAVLAGGTEQPGTSEIGKDLGQMIGIDPIDIAVASDPASVIAGADAILDFTVPAATAYHAALAAASGTAHIIGTTGCSAEDEAAIRAGAENTVVVMAGNMSLGVNLLTQLTRRIAAALGDDYDIEVIEMHHRHKVDAPSGTALMLGRAAAAGRGIDHDTNTARGRDGITGERQRGSIGYAALRGGNVVGEHSVIFAADDERIEITHKAGDRSIFARGAVRAALWSHGKTAGFYDMVDVLGLKD